MSTLATGRTTTLIKLVFAAAAKVSAAFVAFALTALVTRNLPPDEAGLFLLGFSLLGVLSVFFRLGLDNVVLRFLSARSADAFAQEKLNRGLLWIASSTIPATIVGMVLSQPIATLLFNKPSFGPVLFWMLPALPAMALFFLLSMAFQSQHRVVLATLFQNLGISTLFILGFGGIWLADHNAITLRGIAKVYSSAAIIMLLLGVWLWFRQPGINFAKVPYHDKEMSHAAKNLWMASCMSLAVQWSAVLIAGAFVSNESLAHLAAAQRTSMLVAFILMVIEIVVAPRYAKYWVARDIVSLHRLVKVATLIGSALGLSVALVILFFSKSVMSLFGEGFEDGYVLLVIMALGQALNVITGTVSHVLIMCGYESVFRKVTFYTGFLSIFISYLMVEAFGVVGAASAIAIGVAFQNISAYLMVRKYLGFWMHV